MNDTTKTATAYRLPIGLTFSGTHLVPGRGDAGWTVIEFATREAARAWMVAHAEARLACWLRIEREGL